MSHLLKKPSKKSIRQQRVIQLDKEIQFNIVQMDVLSKQPNAVHISPKTILLFSFIAGVVADSLQISLRRIVSWALMV